MNVSTLNAQRVYFKWIFKRKKKEQGKKGEKSSKLSKLLIV